MIRIDDCRKANQHQPLKGLKLAALSLGCSKNRVDTENILGLLCDLGVSLISDHAKADLIIVNTCSFIESAQEESINTILNIKAETKANKPLIIAAGCLVETAGSGIIKKIPEISGAIGVHSYRHLEQLLMLLLRNKRVAIKREAGSDFFAKANRILTTPAHSVNIKIADGCSNSCHYCLIPQIRGSFRSRDPQDIISEIAYFLSKGAREISLIAQDTTAYGSDRERLPDFTGLLKEVLKLNHNFWLRIMYAYPSRITPELINLIAFEPRICNYLDLPIQHSNSKILFSMGRRYNRGKLEQLVSDLRARIPSITLRTTCMVGYPGEGSREFSDLLSFIRQQRFDHLGAFAFSKQKGTAADSIKSSTPIRVVNNRHRKLMLEQQKVSYRKNLRRVGSLELVMVDSPITGKKDYYYGRTEKEAPEVDGKIILYSEAPLVNGDLVMAKIFAAQPYALAAKRLVTLKDFPF